MAEGSARFRGRPHDYAEIVLGLVAALSPIWLTTDTTAMWTLIVLGALVALDGFASLAFPSMVYGEGFQIVLGVLMFIAPWVMSFSNLSGASWTSWIIGALTVVVGGMALPLANAEHSRMAGQH